MRRLLHLINDVSLGWMLAALSLTILLFATGYWVAAQSGDLVFGHDESLRPSFGDAVYFSIVTISSLGYGDIRPEGWARVLVSLEVIVGLAFLGVLVAKISSVKQDYILERMYTQAVDAKLEKFIRELEEQRNLYRITSQMLVDGEIDPELTTTFRRDAPGATFFSLFRQLIDDVSDLMFFEARNRALFGRVDDSRIDSIYDAIRGVLRRTLQLWQQEPQTACDLVLCGNAEDIASICDTAERLARLGRKESHNPVIIEICDAIIGLAADIKTQVLPEL